MPIRREKGQKSVTYSSGNWLTFTVSIPLQGQQAKVDKTIMTDNFETGKQLGRKAYARVSRHGKRWKERNIPSWMRDELLKPYLLTEEGGEKQLYVLQYPMDVGEKVHYLLFARRSDDG